jgi:hypothetical protein
MPRRSFGYFGPTGVALSGPKYSLQVTQIPQGLVTVFVDDNALNFLLLLDRKAHDHIRHIDLPILMQCKQCKVKAPGCQEKGETFAYLGKTAIIKTSRL